MRRLNVFYVMTLLIVAAFASGELEAAAVKANRLPNFVVIFCDDLGYGDLGCYGHPTLKTPNLDQMAAEGMKLTSCYAAASVCTPSRAGLMLGRLPIRSGMCGKRRVLFPDSVGGLQESEITIAEKLKERGYATACVGKWHLGHHQQYLPPNHGFDFYFGIPYSNDMDNVSGLPWQEGVKNPNVAYFNVPLIRNLEEIERPANQLTITQRYTQEATKFIKENKDGPFFLYFPHTFPHVPLFASEKFDGKSLRGLYGDVVEELDWSVGQVLKTLKENGLAENTLVVFSSDNGPWMPFDEQGGSAGLLREGKGSTWEGGMREPTVAWRPGFVPAGAVNAEMCSLMDLYGTFCSMAGAEAPQDRMMDTNDLTATLAGNGPSPRKEMFYWRDTRLMAVRFGKYKAHFVTQDAYTKEPPVEHDPPLLFDLEVDPGEKYPLKPEEHQPQVKKAQELRATHLASVADAPPSQLDRK